MLKHVIVLSMFACVSAQAAEENLEFKLVTKSLDVKMLEAPNIPGQHVMSMKAFGVAYFKDGRVAAKDFVYSQDLMKGTGPFYGYSTYTFEDGSSIIARFDGKYEAGKPQHGDYTVLSGTGKYAGAKGKGSFDALPAEWKGAALLFDGKFQITTDTTKAQ